jgi:hypothetical protein
MRDFISALRRPPALKRAEDGCGSSDFDRFARKEWDNSKAPYACAA